MEIILFSEDYEHLTKLIYHAKYKQYCYIINTEQYKIFNMMQLLSIKYLSTATLIFLCTSSLEFINCFLQFSLVP